LDIEVVVIFKTKVTNVCIPSRRLRTRTISV
jgi:hypothetical protein